MSVQRTSGAWRRKILGAAVVVTAAVVGWAAVAEAADPAGNNGTVKVHDGSAEVSPVTHDDSHVCTFHLHFLFADAGQAGDWRIESWAPGGDRSIELAGTYRTGANGEDRQPETAAYSVPDGHYKLFWRGSTDHAWKQKVFWVECALSSPSPSVIPSARVSPSPSASHRHDASPSPSLVSPSAVASPSGTGEVLDIVTTPPPTSTGEAVAASSARTVGLVVLLLLVFAAAVQATRLVAVLGIRSR